MIRGTLLLSLFAAACAAQEASSSAEAAAAVPYVIPGRYIVEYEEGHDDTAAFESSIASDAEIKMDLNFELFKGASIHFHDSENTEATAAKVAAMPAVKQIWPVRSYPLPKHEVHWTGNVSDSQELQVLRRQGVLNDTFSPHVMTQVNQLRDSGIVGTGIKLAVIDTGVDYKHPALGGCFGPGCLVSFGTDLVGDDYNGANTGVPDSDPMDCAGHGTHVSGIVAAQTNNPFGIIGGATGVTLGHYRVFGCDGSSADDVLIQAFNLAYQEGADIITASIGGTSGWSEAPWSVAVSRIVEKGVPCTVAAGNEGDQGLFYASGAADGKGVTSVASFDNVVSPSLLTAASYTVDDATDATQFGFALGTPSAWADVTLPLWAVNYDTTDNANGCDAYPDSTPDLSKYIVLIRRGTCTFVQKATNAAAKGAKYIIIYNNVAGTVLVDVGAVSGVLALGTVQSDLGAKWIAQLAAGHTVTLAMPDPSAADQVLEITDNALTGGYASTYTTWGPTFEGYNKPQLASPGGNILSTYPLALGGYATLSGTSMATPLTAAIYALIMNARNTKDPRVIENALSATAKPNLWNNGNGASDILAPVAQQGAGLIQAHDAAYATTLLSVSSLSLNDTDNFAPLQTFSLSNTGSADVTYTLSHVGAGTAYTFYEAGTIYPDVFPNEIVKSYAAVDFAEPSFTVAAGAEKQVSLTFTAPTGLDAARLAVYSGYVAINGSDGSALSLPYVGIYGSLKSQVTLDPESSYLFSSADAALTQPPPTPANKTFILPPKGLSNDTAFAKSTEMPYMAVNLVFGTPRVLIDVVPVTVSAALNTTDNLGLTSAGQVLGFPLVYQPRLSFSANWDGRLDSGSYAPEGVYKLVVRSLRVFGDAANKDQYDAVESVPFEIKYLE